MIIKIEPKHVWTNEHEPNIGKHEKNMNINDNKMKMKQFKTHENKSTFCLLFSCSML